MGRNRGVPLGSRVRRLVSQHGSGPGSRQSPVTHLCGPGDPAVDGDAPEEEGAEGAAGRSLSARLCWDDLRATRPSTSPPPCACGVGAVTTVFATGEGGAPEPCLL